MQIVWMRGQSGNNGYWLPGQGQGQLRWTLVPGLEEVACGLNVKYGSTPTGPNVARWCCLLHMLDTNTTQLISFLENIKRSKWQNQAH